MVLMQTAEATSAVLLLVTPGKWNS